MRNRIIVGDFVRSFVHKGFEKSPVCKIKWFERRRLRSVTEKIFSYRGVVKRKFCWMIFQPVLKSQGLHNGYIENIG